MIIETLKNYIDSFKKNTNPIINNENNEWFINEIKDKTTIIVGDNGAGKSIFLKNFFKYLVLNNYVKIAFVSRFDMPLSVKKMTTYEYFKGALDQIVDDWFQKVSVYIKMFNFKFDNFSTFISELSGGECRLIVLIKELILNNDILIIDEPEVYLSKENNKTLLNIIKNHFKNKTLVLATHSNYFASLGEKTFLVKDNKLKKIKNIKSVSEMKKVLWKNKEIFDAKIKF